MGKIYTKTIVLKTLLTTMFLLVLCLSYAQPPLPDRVITVTPTQPIDFGIFYVTGAGTVTVDWNGTRSATGGVVLLAGGNVRPAIFDVKLCQGRNVTITYAPTTFINNGGTGSLLLNIGPTEKGVSGSFFPVNNNCNFITTLRVGGTLEVPGNAQAGTYLGSFPMTFTQE